MSVTFTEQLGRHGDLCHWWWGSLGAERAGKDLIDCGKHEVSGRWATQGSLSGSKAQDQPSSLLSPLPQAEAQPSTCEHWETAASDSGPTGEPESSSEGQGEDHSDGDPSDGDPSDEDWRSQRKHVFVLSEAGKPIYSRYGSVEALSATMGVMTALVSFVQSAGDAIRAIYAGE